MDLLKPFTRRVHCGCLHNDNNNGCQSSLLKLPFDITTNFNKNGLNPTFELPNNKFLTKVYD